MKTHDEMVRKWMEDPDFVREYDNLEQEFALFDELLRARKEAGLTQAEVAERMATKPSVVARLEAGGGRQKHSPSLATLQRYADAVGCRLEIKMVPASVEPFGNFRRSIQGIVRHRSGVVHCRLVVIGARWG
jgi:transcriptional regulator with XRE-family HTH domain